LNTLLSALLLVDRCLKAIVCVSARYCLCVCLSRCLLQLPIGALDLLLSVEDLLEDFSITLARCRA
jgi:hypothetical protein